MADVQGIAFPSVDGDRSSTRTGQQVIAAAAAAVDADLGRRVADEPDWYATYDRHTRAIEEACLRDPAATVAAARAGLAALHDRMTHVRDDEEVGLRDVLTLPPNRSLATAEVVGTNTVDTVPRVPYHGQVCTGSTLDRQLDDWLERDIVEPTFVEAIRQVMANPDWLDLSDLTVVVFGGASEMGPLPWLTRWGATTAILDMPTPRLWHQILGHVHAGAGRALFPVRDGDGDAADRAGADLLHEAPAVWDWLQQLEGPLVLGNYVYAHGSINVQVSMAVDLMVEAALARDDGCSVAVLATPTDVYAVPEEAVHASRSRWQERRRSHRLAGSLSGGRVFAPNYPEGGATDGRRVVDAQITQQGCNYALAKRLHRWRALTARADGARSSINVAPATRTRSVTDNRVLKAAYAAAGVYDIEVFEPDTARALMALLLVHDLRSDTSSAAPARVLDHPLDLLGEAACHGGLWRTPYAPGSVLPLAAARGLARPSTWRG